jgi:hypothetical protein
LAGSKLILAGSQLGLQNGLSLKTGFFLFSTGHSKGVFLILILLEGILFVNLNLDHVVGISVSLLGATLPPDDTFLGGRVIGGGGSTSISSESGTLRGRVDASVALANSQPVTLVLDNVIRTDRLASSWDACRLDLRDTQ